MAEMLGFCPVISRSDLTAPRIVPNPRGIDPPNCRTDGSVDARITARLAAIASHRTASGAQSRSVDSSSCRSAARASWWRVQTRAAPAPADPGRRVREGPVLRFWYRAEDRHDLGTPVARSRPHRPRSRGRVRISGRVLSLTDRGRRADYRGALVGSAILWPDQARG